MKFLGMRKYDLFGYVFLLPWLVGLGAFVIYPVFTSIYWSMRNVRITPFGIQSHFIGRENFHTVLIQRPIFMEQIYSYMGRIILSVPIVLVFSLLIAIMLNADIKFRGFFRLLFFLPAIISSGPVMDRLVNQGATAVDMVDMLDQYAMFAIVENLLPPFIADPIIYIFRQIIVILWFSGVQILIFLAALQKIDTSLYEAAAIDGASIWESFWKITLPTLRPILLVTSAYTVISMAVFDSNPIINSIRNTMFDANHGYGLASAMAWVSTVAILLIVALCFILFKDKREKKEKQIKTRSTYQNYLNKSVVRQVRRSA